MKTVSVYDAVGKILCHDITQIIPNVTKGVAFKKGHIICQNDIPVLLSLGKENIFVWEKMEGMLHENDAAIRIKDAIIGKNIKISEIKEGKINFIAEEDGLFKIDKNLLYKINSIDQIIIASIHTNTPVKKGDILAATRVIPLVIDENKIIELEDIMEKLALFEVIPYKKVSLGIITTGSEIYHGRIKDAFGPIIKSKFAEYGSYEINQIIVDDDEEIIKDAIIEYFSSGVDIVVCTGGMSVDPDDITPTAINKTGAEIIKYGAPSLPGAMFLMAYLEGKEILGLPGCVMYSKRTVLDLILPRILAGEKISKQDIIELGHGGLCLSCNICRFPYCSFGK